MPQPFIPGSDVDVVKGITDIKKTEKSIKEILKSGTPRWATHPNEYRNYAIEAMQEEKEMSDEQVASFRMADQEILTNAVARKVYPIGTRDFIHKLRAHGVRCFTIDNG